MTPAEQLSEEMQRLAQELGIDFRVTTMLPVHFMAYLLETEPDHELANELSTLHLKIISYFRIERPEIFHSILAALRSQQSPFIQEGTS